MRLPNFLIAGSAKSGTTSVYSWLKQHPDVFFPDWKEPSYFVHHYGVSTWEEYASLFRPGQDRKIIGDASGSYLTGLESPAWLKRELGPDVKILILLRHPVDRAFSLYKWMAMEGYERHFPFERALEVEDQRFADPDFAVNSPEYFWDYMYKRSSFYSDNIQSFIKTFGLDAIRLHLFDDLIRSPERIYADVCQFLDLPASPAPSFTRENPSLFPRSAGLQFRLRRLANRRHIAGVAGGVIGRLGGKLMNINKALGPAYRLRSETRAALGAAFKPDLLRLETVLGRHLPPTWYA